MQDTHLQQRAKARLGNTLRGKWLLEELVGVGGMAAVYRSHHRNGACVAVKMLHPSLADNDELRRRFVGEGYAANRINHPAVVKIHDDDVDDDGTPFLVMDFVEGETLADKIQDRRMTDDELLDVAEQVCAALETAHAAGVVHRDLKPDNLLMDSDGKLRVLDFGIARLLDDEESFFSTKTGIAFGTPGFISPEQALGHRHKVGPRTDLFAVGATLFYLATGEFLHAAETPQELLILVATRPARQLWMVAPHLSPAVCELVDRATRMSLDQRWQSAAEMLAATRAIQALRRGEEVSAPEPVIPPPPTDPQRMIETRSAEPPRHFSPSLLGIATRPSISRRVERRRKSVFAVGGAVAMVIGAITFLSASRPEPAPARAEAVYAIAEATSTAVTDEAAPEARELNQVQIVSTAPAARPVKKSVAKAPPPAKKPSHKADPSRIIDALLAGKSDPRLGY